MPDRVISSSDLTMVKTRAIARRGGLTVNGLDCSVPTEHYATKLRAAGIGCVHLTVADMDVRGNLHPFVRVLELLDEPTSSFRLCRSVAEILTAESDGRIALVLGWQNADPIGVDPGTLRAYLELGLRIIGIAYNATNRYGGGCLEPSSGLTAEGRALVEQIHRLGMLLDVGGHTGDRCSLDAIAVSAGRPVICSHTALFALNPNPRNTSNAVCEAIARTGGVIGVVAVSDFMARNATNAHASMTPQAPLDRMLDHLDYLRNLVGADHVALGPDFCEGVEANAVTEAVYPGIRWTREMISDGDDVAFVSGFESIDQLSNVTDGLLRRGWSEDDLEKILRQNWLRVYRAAWGR
jgi:membrane dipeptidase